MSPTTIADRQGQIDEAYRAIGRYVVTFSHLVRDIRELVERRLAPTHNDDLALPQIALGGAEAMAISKAFFGMCRRVAQFDDNERRVEKVLRNAVVKTIEERNAISHGDWYVGLRDWPTDGVRDPILERFHALRADGHEEEITYSLQRLEEASVVMEDLINNVVEFGRLALDLPVLLTPRGVSCDLRVRDVWTARGSKADTTISRNGPRAADVAVVRH